MSRIDWMLLFFPIFIEKKRNKFFFNKTTSVKPCKDYNRCLTMKWFKSMWRKKLAFVSPYVSTFFTIYHIFFLFTFQMNKYAFEFGALCLLCSLLVDKNLINGTLLLMLLGRKRIYPHPLQYPYPMPIGIWAWCLTGDGPPSLFFWWLFFSSSSTFFVRSFLVQQCLLLIDGFYSTLAQ